MAVEEETKKQTNNNFLERLYLGILPTDSRFVLQVAVTLKLRPSNVTSCKLASFFHLKYASIKEWFQIKIHK